MVELKIAGGQIVKCAVNSAGPLPAESGPYKMTGAGFALGPDESGKRVALIFAFNLETGGKAKPSHITVEDVSEDPVSMMVDDPSPKIEKKAWSGRAKPVVVSEKTTPWLYDGQRTVMIFRVTISAKDSPDVVLYQPALYAAQMKASVVDFAKQKEKG